MTNVTKPKELLKHTLSARWQQKQGVDAALLHVAIVVVVEAVEEVVEEKEEEEEVVEFGCFTQFR